MGLRGPKPVDVKCLESEAMQWACFFYTLRDGQPGFMQRVKWVPLRLPPRGSAKWVRIGSDEASLIISAEMLYRKDVPGPPMTAHPLGPPILLSVSEPAQKLPTAVIGKDWKIFPPVVPKPDIWEKLKHAQTVSQVKKAIKGMAELQMAFASSTPWAGNPAGAIRRYAEGVLAAKQLPHYPRAERPRSDDKRVLFLAKSMAGLTLGLSAITAVKLLSHWHWPKDWAEKTLREFVDREKQKFVKHIEGEMR